MRSSLPSTKSLMISHFSFSPDTVFTSFTSSVEGSQLR